MKSYIGLFALVLLALTQGVFSDADKADDGPATEDAAVVSLTSETFNAFIQEHKFALVEFFAPWCGHCKRLAPEYEAAAKILIEEGIPLANVDATVETELATKFEIGGYPTVKAFRNGIPEEYKGGRTKDAIVQWVHQMTGPSVVEVDSVAAAEKAAQNTTTSFIGTFKSKDSPAFKVFQTVGDANRQMGKFIAVLGGEGDSIVTVREEEGKTEPHTITTEEDLKSYVGYERFPLFGPINAGNYGDYFQNERDLFWFVGVKGDYEAAGKTIREVAKTFRSKCNFIWLNTEEYKDHAENALAVTTFPSLVLQRRDGRFIYDQHTFDDPKKVEQFVNDIFDGKIEKHLMSEEIPETNDEPVKVVVGKTLEEMAFQKDKDVFLEVYAPWCGHCKQFEPLYNEFAEAMKANEHLIVAKMDGVKNESPTEKFQWTSFPTVFFIKAGSDTPEVYSGARTVEGLTEYLRENGSKPIPSEKAKEEL